MTKILIVEDNDISQMILEDAFSKSKNIDLFFAKTATEAIKVLGVHPKIDLVTLDGNLKDGSEGADVARHIREKMWSGVEMKRPVMVGITGEINPIDGTAAAYVKPIKAIEIAKDPDAWVKKMMVFSDQKNGYNPSRPEMLAEVTQGGRSSVVLVFKQGAPVFSYSHST